MTEKSDHDMLMDIHTVLLGTNGQGGLYRQVKDNTKNINRIWIVLAVLAASVGGGTWGIVNKLLGS